MNYAYACANHGIIEAPTPADSIVCLECGLTAKRVRSFAVDKKSMKTADGWNPIVGQYVRNEREFNEILKAGIDRESNELNMEVKLATLDARDKEGLAELHGHTVAEREHVADVTAKKKHDDAVKV